MEPVLDFALFFGVCYYLLSPILIYFTLRPSARLEFAPVNFQEYPAEVNHYFYTAIEGLVAEGFTPIAYASLPHQLPNVVPLIALLLNRSTGDRANVTAMFTKVNDATKFSARYVEFCTTFVDDKEFDTNNNKMAGAFKKNPHKIITRLPEITDPRQLYAVHRAILEHVPHTSEKVVWPENEALARLAEVVIKDYDKQVAYGYFRRTASGDKYQPTWKGAYLMTWSQVFPIKQWKLAQQRKDTQALLRQLNLQAVTESR